MRQRAAEPAVIALTIIACGGALGLAGAVALAPAAALWPALGVAAGYSLSGST
ncbi:hypothetical protein [Nonomuraea basaltis]|uniref:hypothetical protein n=1 Tax=Nonomuraea basaltis TaxID=2495887 RepID=UPI0014869033|nr:hypothetical protein [Nonomuraea basaltis]